MAEPRRNYVLDMIIKNLDEVNKSLDNLSTFTNVELSHIKTALALVIQDVEFIKNSPCPRADNKIREIIEIERLKFIAKRPKKFMEIIGWITAVAVGFLTIYFAIEKIFTIK